MATISSRSRHSPRFDHDSHTQRAGRNQLLGRFAFGTSTLGVIRLEGEIVGRHVGTVDTALFLAQ